MSCSTPRDETRRMKVERKKKKQKGWWNHDHLLAQEMKEAEVARRLKGHFSFSSGNKKTTQVEDFLLSMYFSEDTGCWPLRYQYEG